MILEFRVKSDKNNKHFKITNAQRVAKSAQRRILRIKPFSYKRCQKKALLITATSRHSISIEKTKTQTSSKKKRSSIQKKKKKCSESC